MDKFWQNLHYRTIFEATSNAQIIVESDTTIKYANQRFCRLVGLKKDEIESNMTWSEFVAPEDKKRLLKYHLWRRSNKHRSPENYEFSLIDANNQLKHCLVKVTMMPQTDLSFASIIEISDRIRSDKLLKQSQAQFKTIFNHAPVSFILINQNRKIEKVNKAVTKLLDISTQEFDKYNVDELIKKKYLPQEMKLICSPRQNHHFDQIEFNTILGKHIFLKIIAAKIKSPNQHCQWLLMLEDISDTVKANSIISQLPNRILKAHEEEKLLISREIHDTVSQSLAALKMDIQTGSDQKELITQVNQLIRISRTLSQSLRPDAIDNLGIIPALEQLAKNINQQFSSRISIITNDQQLKLDSDIALQLYRISQEALLNSTRHGQAKNITVDLFTGHNRLKLTITDDGKGFDVKQAASTSKKSDSLGLKIMLERAKRIGAEFTIKSKIGLGTKIAINCKINQSQKGANI